MENKKVMEVVLKETQQKTHKKKNKRCQQGQENKILYKKKATTEQNKVQTKHKHKKTQKKDNHNTLQVNITKADTETKQDRTRGV